VKAVDEKSSSHETKRIIKEIVDLKALKLSVSKTKNLANEAVFVECRTETDRDILEKELIKRSALTVGRLKKKLPTLLLKIDTDRDIRCRNQKQYPTTKQPTPTKRLRLPKKFTKK
jgi:hypothetical protein